MYSIACWSLGPGTTYRKVLLPLSFVEVFPLYCCSIDYHCSFLPLGTVTSVIKKIVGSESGGGSCVPEGEISACVQKVSWLVGWLVGWLAICLDICLDMKISRDP